jgi:hypothetical protein
MKNLISDYSVSGGPIPAPPPIFIPSPKLSLKGPNQIIVFQSKGHQQLHRGLQDHFQILLFFKVFSAFEKRSRMVLPSSFEIALSRSR